MNDPIQDYIEMHQPIILKEISQTDSSSKNKNHRWLVININTWSILLMKEPIQYLLEVYQPVTFKRYIMNSCRVIIKKPSKVAAHDLENKVT